MWPVQTEIDDVPTCLMSFQGRLVAGVGKALRIYDIGKKKMLRKCENSVSPPSLARFRLGVRSAESATSSSSLPPVFPHRHRHS